MAAAKKPTHRVIHKKFNFIRGGEKGAKTERLPIGTMLTLTKKQAEVLVARGFVEPIGDVEAVDVSGKEVEGLETAVTDLKDKLTASDTKVTALTEELARLKIGVESVTGLLDASEDGADKPALEETIAKLKALFTE